MSSRSRKISYFLTERGRSLVFGSVVTIGAGLFAGHYLPNTIFIDKYKEIVQAYRFVFITDALLILP